MTLGLWIPASEGMTKKKGMDSRLRGNDEGGYGNDEGGYGNDKEGCGNDRGDGFPPSRE